MKKIISLLVVAVMMTLCLASCESGVGDFQYDYNPVKTKEISLNMYIIYDDCGSVALTTVADDIADYTETKFKTKVNVIYKTASEYKAAVTGAIAATQALPENATQEQINQVNEIKPGIVLINSEELMGELMNDEALLDLTAMYATKAYGTLNAQINSALLEASKLTVEGSSDKKLFTVPNNRVLGEYTYLLINKEAAKADFATNEGDWDQIKTYEDAVEILPEGSYEIVKGNYNLRFEYKDSEYYFNDYKNTPPIIEYPTVTAEDAFASAFAVVKGGAIPKTAGDAMDDTEFVSRAMQIIYAINTDTTFRNILQYGRLNSNYVVADGSYDEQGEFVENGGAYDIIEDSTVPAGRVLLPDGRNFAIEDLKESDGYDKTKGYVLVPNGYFIPIESETSYYKMNLEYTGDVFKAANSYYPTENYGWDADDYNNGIEQNKDVLVAE